MSSSYRINMDELKRITIVEFEKVKQDVFAGKLPAICKEKEEKERF